LQKCAAYQDLPTLQVNPKTCNFTICSIFSNSGHVGWCTVSPDTILKLDTIVMIQNKFGFHEHMVKLQVLGNNSKTVNNIKNLTRVKMISTSRSTYLGRHNKLTIYRYYKHFYYIHSMLVHDFVSGQVGCVNQHH
jgi:hypothetical protein